MQGKIAGQDESARKEDAKGYKTTPDMLTGGVYREVGDQVGPEVTAPFGKDPLSKTKSE